MTASTNRTLPPLQSDQRAISLSERDVRDATRLLSLIAGERQTEESPVRGREPSHGGNDLKACARRLYEERKGRVSHFGLQMFGEPAWEMLLILYLEEGGERKAQARLVEISGASRSTGQRWIDYLVRKDFARREEHPTDKRRNFISLSDKGRRLLELYLSETCS